MEPFYFLFPRVRVNHWSHLSSGLDLLKDLLGLLPEVLDGLLADAAASGESEK